MVSSKWQTRKFRAKYGVKGQLTTLRPATWISGPRSPIAKYAEGEPSMPMNRRLRAMRSLNIGFASACGIQPFLTWRPFRQISRERRLLAARPMFCNKLTAAGLAVHPEIALVDRHLRSIFSRSQSLRTQACSSLRTRPAQQLAMLTATSQRSRNKSARWRSHCAQRG